PAIGEGFHAGRYTQAPRARLAARRQAMAARAWVWSLAVGAGARAAQRRVGDLAPGTAAAIYQAARGQRVEGALVGRAALRLPQHVAIPVQLQRAQLVHDDAGRAGHGARGVDVFDAQQPAPAMRAGVEPAGQGGY